VRRVGAKDTIHVQTRVIAATNRNLNQLVSEGKFREDLLWRLSGKKILLPPLRERPQDIPELTKYFFSQDKFRKKEILDDAMAVLTNTNGREMCVSSNACANSSYDGSPARIAPRRCLAGSEACGHRAGPANYDFNRGLAELVNEFEAQIIQKSPLHAERY